MIKLYHRISLNAMVGNSKTFYAGYLTTNKATCKVS